MLTVICFNIITVYVYSTFVPYYYEISMQWMYTQAILYFLMVSSFNTVVSCMLKLFFGSEGGRERKKDYILIELKTRCYEYQFWLLCVSTSAPSESCYFLIINFDTIKLSSWKSCCNTFEKCKKVVVMITSSCIANTFADMSEFKNSSNSQQSPFLLDNLPTNNLTMQQTTEPTHNYMFL